MYLEIPAQGPESIFNATARVYDKELPLWPPEQSITTLADPRIFGTRFPDHHEIDADMIREVMAQDGDHLTSYPGVGGRKVRAKETWLSPAGKLLTLRALLFYMRCCGVRSAHTVDRWANVTDPGEYSSPHGHYDSQVAVVYFLEPGDSNPAFPFSGKFEFIDARIPWCCSTRPECPTRSLMPEIAPGTMILFPALFVHFVHPYAGKRPRITLAWNLSEGPEPPGNEEKMIHQVSGAFS